MLSHILPPMATILAAAKIVSITLWIESGCGYLQIESKESGHYTDS